MTDTAAPIVLKFGGTSVGSPERIRAVAKIVADARAKTERVAVVVSAMGETTDTLIALAKDVSPHALDPRNRREMDMLLTSGERVSMALLSLALADLGLSAVSFTGSQSGILTDTVHGEARISEIRPVRIRESLDAGRVVIVAGFQGVSQDREITTLGRGGSDTTAVALAASLGASRCLIYTDVDGFYSADPRLVPSARKHDRVGWDTAVLAAHFGAQILHPRCVELAWKAKLPVEVLSSFRSALGTTVSGEDAMNLEGPKVFTVAVQRELKSMQVGPIDADEAAKVFADLRRAGLKVGRWNQEGATVHLVVDASSRDPEPEIRSFTKATLRPGTAVARVTLIGSGLLNDAELPTKLAGLARDASVPMLGFEALPTFVSLTVEDVPGVTSLLASIHRELVG